MSIDTDYAGLTAYARFNTQMTDARTNLQNKAGGTEAETESGRVIVDTVSDFIAALQDYLNQRLGAALPEGDDETDDFIRATSADEAAIDAGGGNNEIYTYNNAGVRAGSGNDYISAYANAMIDAGDGNNTVDTYGNATIRTGNGADRIDTYDNANISSGDGDDVISAYDNVTVWASGGNNRIDAYDNARIHTGDGDDTIDVYRNARIETGAGNDTVRAYGNATVSLGDGDDRATVGDNGRLDGGTGNDWLSAGENAQIFGGDGDDEIYGRNNAMLDGGEGNDRIYAFRNALIQGGAGDDTIDVGGESTILFARGDGNDTLQSASLRGLPEGIKPLMANGPTMEERYGGLGTSNVQFADDIAPDDIRVTVNGDDLVISIADTGDSMTVAGGNNGAPVPGLAFANGTQWSPAEVLSRAAPAA